MMNLNTFRASLASATPPAASTPLQSLWYAAKGDWKMAHDLLQNDNSADGSWVHAYLHRIEPDLPHATAWYQRAGKPVASESFDSEWDAIAADLLSR